MNSVRRSLRCALAANSSHARMAMACRSITPTMRRTAPSAAVLPTPTTRLAGSLQQTPCAAAKLLPQQQHHNMVPMMRFFHDTHPASPATDSDIEQDHFVKNQQALLQSMRLVVFKKDFSICVDDEKIIYKAGNRPKHNRPFLWSELESVEVEVLDGPLVHDRFWVISNNKDSVRIPIDFELQGHSELMKRLVLMPGFRAQELANAFNCTHEDKFTVWTRE